MKKSSIFSDAYNKDKKRRKQLRNLLLVLALAAVLLLFFIPYLLGKVSEYQANGGKFPSSLQTSGGGLGTTGGGNTMLSSGSVAGSDTTAPALTAPVAPMEEAEYVLSTGDKIRVVFIEDGDGVSFSKAAGQEGKYYYDISPDQSKILINEKADSSLILINDEFAAEDNSLNEYTDSEGTTMTRQEYGSSPDFIWCAEAKFFSDEEIIFVSNLNSDNTKKAIWTFNLLSGNYRIIEDSQAQTIEFRGRSDKGFAVKLDETIKYIGSDLRLTE